jgi:PAS domain S-box-containing protein
MDGTILLWNEGACRIYGYEPDEVVDKANADMLHTPEDMATGKPEEIRKAALRDGSWEGNIERLRKDARRFMARVGMTPRHDAAGTQVGFLLISKDITNDLRFTEEIRKAKLFDIQIFGNAQAVDFITNILESSTEYSIIGKDLEGKILLWNEGARRLYGYEPEEVVGKQNSSILHTPEEGIKLALQKGRVTNYELTGSSRDGRSTVVSNIATTFRDAVGKLQGVFTAARDITEQKKLEQQLRDPESYNRGLIEASVDGLITGDPSATITEAVIRVRRQGKRRVSLAPLKSVLVV